MARKRSQREFEELLLKDILIELEVSEEDYWDQKATELADIPDREPTPEQRAAFEKRLDLEVKRIQNQKRQIAQARSLRRQRTQRFLRRAAMAAAAIMIFVGVTLYNTVDAFAAGVDRFIATVVPDEGAEELRTNDKKGGGVELNVEDFRGMYIPDKIPWGYFVSYVEIRSGHNKIVYTNRDNDVICYEISKPSGSLFIDDEDVSSNKIYLLDTWGRVIEIDNLTSIVWEDGNYIYTITGNVELREKLIEMAEKCIKID